MMNKKLKKLLALILSVAVLASLGITAAAAGPMSGSGGGKVMAAGTPGGQMPDEVREHREAVAALNQQQKALMQQIKDCMKTSAETMRSITAEVKEQIAAARGTEDGQEVTAALLTELNTLRSQIQTTKAQMSALAGDAHTVQAQVKLLWNEYLAAEQSGDDEAADAILLELAPLKEQILAITGDILELRQEACDFLTAFLADVSA